MEFLWHAAWPTALPQDAEREGGMTDWEGKVYALYNSIRRSNGLKRSEGPTSICNWPLLGTSSDGQDYPTLPFMYLLLRVSSLQLLCRKCLEEYGGHRSSSGDLDQGVLKCRILEFWKGLQRIPVLLMTKALRPREVTRIIKASTRTQIS